MKKTVLYLFLCFSFIVSAQVTNEGTPASWNLRTVESIESIKMPAFDLQAMQAEDAINDYKFDRPWRFGKEFMVNHDLNNSGSWTTLENGDRIWRIRFQSEGAVTMNFLFEDFYLPRGGTIYLYNNDRTALLGAYDHAQNNNERVLGTWLIDGDDVWIEYFEPAKEAGQGILQIGRVVHGYRSQAQFAQNRGLNDSGPCNLDVDCEIDADLESFKNHNKKGVVMLLSGSSGFCSGSLINNTANDGTPYILTARHCGQNPTNWAFRFNWISPNPVCASTQNSSNGPTTQTMSGAQSRAMRQQSDFHLVEINNPIPSEWDVVWNGWDRSDVPPSKTFGIHHPSGDIMKVCVDNDPPYHASSPGQVWWLDSWDTGVTEPGSSGSPLFDDNGRIIGQLWGGLAACSGTSNNGQYDYYGRFGVSWDVGGTAATQLKDWLDPGDTGVTSLDPFPPLEVYNYNAAISISNVESIICSNVIEPVLTIRNFGLETLVSADVSYHLDDQTPILIEWTGSLETGEQEQISLNPISISEAGIFHATIENPNGQTDQFPANNQASVSFDIPDVFETTEVIFTLIPDNYGSETTWEFVNSAGDILYSGGPYQNNNNTPIIQTFTLTEEDCYTFTIYDSWGDGICCDYGEGSYTLETADGTIIFEGGEFGSAESTTFSNSEVLNTSNFLFESQITMYPNPSTGLVNIANATGNNLKYEVYSMLGQLIVKGNNQNTTFAFDMSNVTTGLYFVKITDTQTNSTTTKKLILK